jgi:nanoRNase/pAp phosphatase (c-di-AMP/oligoRNAs hydrolase)
MQQGVSYRCVKDNIDVSEIASVYGGGGHIKASGSPMDNTLKKEVIKLIFKDYAMFDQ